MDYRYLKAFMTTAKLLSFSKAAEALNIAQSAVSRQIKLLEESIGQELIIRSSKKVLLTEKGIELFRAVQQFEKSMENIFESEAIKVIRIGTLHGLLETWLTNIIGEYSNKFPHNVEVTIGTPQELKQGINEGKFDIIFTPENIQNELVSSLKLFNEKLVLISKKEVEQSKISSYNWVVYDEQDYLFRLYKRRSKKIFCVRSITSIIQLVKQNVGIAIVPEHILRSNDRLFKIEMKNSSSEASSIYMATLNYKILPGHFKEFIEEVKRQALI